MKICQIPHALGATLLCLSMGFSSLAHAAICDADTDGDVDRQDIVLIIRAQNTPAGGLDDPRDPDGDGKITMLDARTCVRQCNLPDCVIIDPTPPSDQFSTGIQERALVSSTEWKVMRGDTLYAIGRAVYPGDARRQASLRQDIMKLNPPVFANGANNMAVGTVLKLPDYVVPKSAPSQLGAPAQIPTPVPTTVTPMPAPHPAASAPVVKPEPEGQAKKESSVANEQSAFYPVGAEGNFLVSLGYSYGGDKLVNADGSYDPAGAGGQLRLGYEQMYRYGGGYRFALGLQYGLGKGSENTSFSDTYLQLAYQYRANPFVYGIGVVFSEGATFKNDSTTEYDGAVGAVVYLENIGSGALAGWGLSYTSLEIEEKNTSISFDVSRAELYYTWRF
jgi:hypothetical protein